MADTKQPEKREALPEKKPAPPKSNHFTVYCGRYPSFSFGCPELRAKRMKERGASPNRFGVTLQFERGVFDSKLAGLDEEEAAIVRRFLESRNSTPAWGVHILENSMAVKGADPAGQHACVLCGQHFTSAAGMVEHYRTYDHEAAAEGLHSPVDLTGASIEGRP